MGPIRAMLGPCYGHVAAMLSLCWAKNGVIFVPLINAYKNAPFLGSCQGLCGSYVGLMLVRVGLSGHVGIMLGGPAKAREGTDFL